MGVTWRCFFVTTILAGALFGTRPTSAAHAEADATLLKPDPVIMATGSDAEPWRGTACNILLIVAGWAPDAPVSPNQTHVAPATGRCAALPAILTGISRPPSEEMASLLPGHRCMALAGVRPVFVLSKPRAVSRRLGAAPDQVITADPPRVVNGYARMLQRNGQPGWVRRNRLREWAVAASPGLRCLPARMLDGSLGFTYAHPG